MIAIYLLALVALASLGTTAYLAKKIYDKSNLDAERLADLSNKAMLHLQSKNSAEAVQAQGVLAYQEEAIREQASHFDTTKDKNNDPDWTAEELDKKFFRAADGTEYEILGGL